MRLLIGELMLVVAASACALDPGKDPSAVEGSSDDSTAGKVEPQSIRSEDGTVVEPPSPSSAGGVTSLTRGCAHVVWCDKPNDPIGTICQQDGCNLTAARAECFSDLAALGCNLHCPGIIRGSGGGVTSLCGRYCPPDDCRPGCPC